MRYANLIFVVLTSCYLATEDDASRARARGEFDADCFASRASPDGCARDLSTLDAEVVCTDTGDEICDGVDNDCNGEADDGLEEILCCWWSTVYVGWCEDGRIVGCGWCQGASDGG